MWRVSNSLRLGGPTVSRIAALRFCGQESYGWTNFAIYKGRWILVRGARHCVQHRLRRGAARRMVKTVGVSGRTNEFQHTPWALHTTYAITALGLFLLTVSVQQLASQER